MLRTPTSRLHLRVFRGDAAIRWAGSVSLGLLISASSALACTQADMATGHDTADGEAGMVHMTSAARLDTRAGMAPAEGLKLRTRQEETVLSAYLTPPSLGSQVRPATRPASTERSAAMTERSPAAVPAQPRPDNSAEHAYKPVAMLAAALALMVTIALRRSGKR